MSRVYLIIGHQQSPAIHHDIIIIDDDIDDHHIVVDTTHPQCTQLEIFLHFQSATSAK